MFNHFMASCLDCDWEKEVRRYGMIVVIFTNILTFIALIMMGTFFLIAVRVSTWAKFSD